MNRAANLALGLSRRTNDSLAQVTPFALAEKFNLPVKFVARLLAEEFERRGM